MKLRVLGCSGAELPEHKVTSFLINDDTLLDAGTVVSSLTFEEQTKIQNIIVSHVHLDHIKDIPFLVDNIVGAGSPINIIGTSFVLNGLKTHIFNNIVWPDFTEIPDKKCPMIKLVPVNAGREMFVSGIKIKPIIVNHTVPSVGYIIKSNDSAFVYTGDTDTTDDLWEEARKESNLKFIITEVSFPNSMEDIANASKHMTPHKLCEAIKKLARTDVRIFVTHMKPQYLDIINEELKTLNELCSCISVLKLGEVIEF